MHDASIVVLTIAVCLLIAVLLPLIWQLWRTARNMAIILETLERSLPGILDNLDEITTDLRSVSATVRKEVDATAALYQKLRLILDVMRGWRGLLPHGARCPASSLKRVRGVARGIKVFFDVLSERNRKSEREEDGSGQDELRKQGRPRSCDQSQG